MKPPSTRLIHWICCGLFALLLIPFSSYAQQNNFETFSIESGLPQSNVYSVLQDSRGYLWIGTDGGGVSRFDGINFRTYNKKNGLAGNVVRSIYEDSSNNIWFGTDEGLSVYDGYQWTTINANDSLKGSTFLCIVEDNARNIWVGTDDEGISCLKGGYFLNEILNYSGDNGYLSNNAIFDLEVDQFGRLWIATLYGGVNVGQFNENDSLEVSFLAEGADIPSGNILAIEEDNEGHLWFGTYTKGIFKILVSSDPELNGSVLTFPNLNSGTVWDIEAASNGQLWFGTGENGVFRYFPEQTINDSLVFANYKKEQGLSNNQVLCILEDHEGNMWLGTNGDGISKYNGDHFSHFTEDEGLASNKITGVQQDGIGNFWVVSDGGGLCKVDFNNHLKPEVTIYNETNGLPSNYITSVSVGQRDNRKIWMSTTKYGIISYDGETFQHFTETEGLLENRVNQVFVDSRGIVWAATAGGLSKWDGAVFKNSSMDDMLVDDDGVKCIIEDRKGNMWVGTAGALAFYDHSGMLTTFDAVEGLTVPDVNAIAEGPNGHIWIGTNGGGLYVYNIASTDSMPISFITNDSLLSSNAINSLIFTKDGQLLVGSDKGMDRIQFDENGNILEVRSYDKTDGFIGVEVNEGAMYMDALGDVWIGTGDGLTRYSPILERPMIDAPETHITDLHLFFKEVNWAEKSTIPNSAEVAPWFSLPMGLSLPHNENHLTFYFTGISMQNPSKVEFRYKLEGRDVDWSPAGRESKVTYSGLSPGEYTFHVIARNAKGDWNENSTSLSFVIRPPWYQTTWFYITCAVLLVIIFYAYVKIRERRLRQEKMVLEQKVEERTAEVVKQKEEIEEKSREIVDSINYAQKIQEAILPANEQMVEQFSDAFVMFKPKDIVSGDFYWMAEKDDLVFFTVADCTGHGVPGAFMSMIGTALLNEAVNVKHHVHPGDILGEVRQGIIDSLKQTGKEGEQKDGMDMALMVYHKTERILEYAGANNSLYYMRKGDSPLIDTNTNEPVEKFIEGENGLRLYEVKANKQPVGYWSAEMHPFTSYKFKIEEGDCAYAFSDGFADQFGGPKGKKFMYKPFKKLLLSNYDEPMQQQLNLLENAFGTWIGELEQIDDVCMMGVKL